MLAIKSSPVIYRDYSVSRCTHANGTASSRPLPNHGRTMVLTATTEIRSSVHHEWKTDSSDQRRHSDYDSTFVWGDCRVGLGGSDDYSDSNARDDTNVATHLGCFPDNSSLPRLPHTCGCNCRRHSWRRTSPGIHSMPSVLPATKKSYPRATTSNASSSISRRGHVGTAHW